MEDAEPRFLRLPEGGAEGRGPADRPREHLENGRPRIGLPVRGDAVRDEAIEVERRGSRRTGRRRVGPRRERRKEDGSSRGGDEDVPPRHFEAGLRVSFLHRTLRRRT